MEEIKNMEEKTYKQYEKDYENIKFNEMKQQSYINDLLHECNQSPYNIDKINILLKLTNGPNVKNSNSYSPLDVAYYSSNFKLIKYLIEQHNAERKIIVHGYFMNTQLSTQDINNILENERKPISCCMDCCFAFWCGPD